MASKLKRILTSILPSYRNGVAIQARIDDLDQRLTQRFNQLDFKTEYLFWLSQQHYAGKPDEDVRKSVFSMLPKAHGDTRMIQLTNLELLKRIKAVCADNQIPFYLIFGNLLGAVRNQGFIPWDDDVDIAMLRGDYERLKALLESDTTLRIVDVFSSHYHKFTKVKFRDSDTFFVDIFIMDVMDASPEQLAERYDHLRRMNLQYVEQVSAFFRQEQLPMGDYQIPKEIPELSEKMSAYFAEIIASCDYYNRGEYIVLGVDNAPFVRDAFYVYEKKELLAPNTVMFEGLEFHAFGNVGIWLQNVYGSYWSFPKNMMSGHGDLAKMSQADRDTIAKYLADEPEAEQWIEHCRSFGSDPIQF